MAKERDEFHGISVSVVGAARSGLAAACVLAQLGAFVTLSDNRPREQFDEEQQSEMVATGATVVLGATIPQAIPAATQLVVTSPGVPAQAPVLQEAQRRGIPIWSEIELASHITDAPIAAITGTNGKTTTTVLLAAMLREAGFNALIAGNISADEIKRTLVDAAFETRNAGTETRSRPVLVAEVSSFQLEWVHRFAPKAAILTNITPDHLNRHSSFVEYAQTKARIFAAQESTDRAILNYDNASARAIGEAGVPGALTWFTTAGPPPTDSPCGWLENGTLMLRYETRGKAVPLIEMHEMPFTLPGIHSVQNVLAAALAAHAFDAGREAMAQAIRTFPGVAHRMELVADVNGVRYINNSMCTNVEAAIHSLAAMDRPTLVIAGGADKALDFAPLVPTLLAKARQVILIGAVSDKMEQTFRAGGYSAISRADSLEEAVRDAARCAVAGEAVLLSPACASFDMFRDFEARGAAFRKAVRTLEEP